MNVATFQMRRTIHQGTASAEMELHFQLVKFISEAEKQLLKRNPIPSLLLRQQKSPLTKKHTSDCFVCSQLELTRPVASIVNSSKPWTSTTLPLRPVSLLTVRFPLSVVFCVPDTLRPFAPTKRPICFQGGRQGQLQDPRACAAEKWPEMHHHRARPGGRPRLEENRPRTEEDVPVQRFRDD